MPSTYEYVIVGGGIQGTALAYELARRGREVLLLEKASIASGASGGFGKRGVRANRRHLKDLPLMEAAYRRWATLAEELGAPTGYSMTGGIYLYEREATGSYGGLVSMEMRQAMQNTFGVPTEILNKERVFEVLPGVSHRVRSALYCPRDGMADQTATTHAYASAARRHGAELWENAEVTDSDIVGGKLRSLTLADGREVAASNRVIIATNGSSPEFLPKLLDVNIPIWTVYPQALTLAISLEELSLAGCLVAHDHRSISLKRLSEDIVQLSGGWRGSYNKRLNKAEPDEGQIQGNINAAAEVFAAFAHAEPQQVAVDRPEAASFDQLPIIDAVPHLPQAVVVTGWSGNGFAIIPVIAELMADWFTTGTKPDKLEPFSIDRFPALSPSASFHLEHPASSRHKTVAGT